MRSRLRWRRWAADRPATPQRASAPTGRERLGRARHASSAVRRWPGGWLARCRLGSLAVLGAVHFKAHDTQLAQDGGCRLDAGEFPHLAAALGHQHRLAVADLDHHRPLAFGAADDPSAGTGAGVQQSATVLVLIRRRSPESDMGVSHQCGVLEAWCSDLRLLFSTADVQGVWVRDITPITRSGSASSSSHGKASFTDFQPMEPIHGTASRLFFIARATACLITQYERS